MSVRASPRTRFFVAALYRVSAGLRARDLPFILLEQIQSKPIQF